MEPLTFRVYCDRHRKKWYVVRIFAAKKEMYAWNKEDGYENRDKKDRYLGLTRAHEVWTIYPKRSKKKDKKSGEIGSISFVVDHTTSGIVSHECTHAALYWFLCTHKKLEKLNNPDYDEKFAWVQGNLVRQVWMHWFKAEKAGRLTSK